VTLPVGVTVFPLASAESSGKVHLLTTLRWLLHRGLIPASGPLTQVGYGWEVRNAAARPGGGLGGTARSGSVLPPVGYWLAGG
jgi:hypothetical protein